jgi:hypothetical protein
LSNTDSCLIVFFQFNLARAARKWRDHRLSIPSSIQLDKTTDWMIRPVNLVMEVL